MTAIRPRRLALTTCLALVLAAAFAAAAPGTKTITFADLMKFRAIGGSAISGRRQGRGLRPAAGQGRRRGGRPRPRNRKGGQGPARRVSGHLEGRPLRRDDGEGAVRAQREDRQGQAETGHGAGGRRRRDGQELRERREIRVLGRRPLAGVSTARAGTQGRREAGWLGLVGPGRGEARRSRRPGPGWRDACEGGRPSEAARPGRGDRAGDRLGGRVRVRPGRKVPRVRRRNRRRQGQRRARQAARRLAGPRPARRGDGQGQVRSPELVEGRQQPGVPVRRGRAGRFCNARDVAARLEPGEIGSGRGAGAEGLGPSPQERAHVVEGRQAALLRLQAHAAGTGRREEGRQGHGA